MRTAVEICHACPFRHRPCAGPCPCLVDGVDILDHVERLDCPKGFFQTEDGSERPRTMDLLTPEQATARAREIEAEQLRIFRQLWREIHTHPTGGSPEFVAEVARRLPCGWCRQHYADACRDRPPEFGGGAWRRWSWWLHNRVNQIKGVPLVDYRTAAAEWGWPAQIEP